MAGAWRDNLTDPSERTFVRLGSVRSGEEAPLFLFFGGLKKWVEWESMETEYRSK